MNHSDCRWEGLTGGKKKRRRLIKVKLGGRLNLEFGVQQAERACGLPIRVCGFNPPSSDDVRRQQGWAHDRLTHGLL